MAKNLISMLGRGIKRAGKGLKKAVLVGTIVAGIGGGFAACDFPVPTPNRAPIVTSIPVEQVSEGGSYNYDVNATDADGDSLTYSLENNHGWMSITPNTGIISGTAPPVDETTYLPVQVKVSDGKTSTPQNYTLTVNDVPLGYVNIQGSLQDCETDTNQPGEVRAYIDIDNDGITDSTLSDTDGYDFSFSVPNGSDVKLKGMIKDGATQKSYVRTLNLEDVISNQTGVKVRCVPYEDFNGNGTIEDWEKEDFKQHMYDTNCTYSRWDLSPSGFQKIKIFWHNNGNGDFNQDQIDLIVSKIKASDDIERFVRGSNLSDTDLDGFPDLDSYIEVVDGDAPVGEPEAGYIYVIPNDDIPEGNAGVTYRWKLIDKTLYKARIELDPDCVNEENKAVSHEFGHAFVAPDGEAITLSSDYTVMWTTGGDLVKPGIGDGKAGKIIYEDTYQSGENLENILGNGW